MTGNIKLAAFVLWFLLPFSISTIATDAQSAGVQGASKLPAVPATGTAEGKPRSDEEEDDEECDDDEPFGAEDITPPSST